MATILVTDDDAGCRRAVAAILRRAGHAVSEADDGTAALKALRDGRFDAMVTDILMPGMDGLELIRQARAPHPDLPILAVSGGGAVAAGYCLHCARALGAMTVLEKPFEPAALLQALEGLLTAKGQADVQNEGSAREGGDEPCAYCRNWG